MTSEIRANTLKNRVGLGTVSFTNTGPIVSGIITANSFSGTLTSNGDITGTGDLTLTSTDAGSSAAPIINLFRNSASPANADYLGQIKFQGESDTGVQRNYAKITGKILDASNGTEDGIIEIAHIKAGSQNISARFRSDSLQLLNDTNLSVAGDTTLTGDLDVDGHTNLDNVSIAGVTTITNSYFDLKPNGGGNAHFRILSTGSGDAGIFFDAANGDIAGSDYVFIGQKNNLDFVINANVNAGNIDFQRAGTTQLRIASNGHVAIGTDSPNSALPLTIAGQYPGIQFKDNQGTTDFNINADSAAFRIQSGTAGAGPSEKFRIGSSGQIGLGGANYGTSGQVLTSAGSGSAATWSTISGTTINNNANNRIITGSGTANTLEGESTFTFDGTKVHLNAGSTSHIQIDGTSSYLQVAGIKVWKGAGNRAHNTAVGNGALNSANGGDDCTAIGHNAYANGTSGEDNTVVGSHALDAAVTGHRNCAFGHASLSALTSGYNNSCYGRTSGFSLLSGHNNTFLGYDAGFSQTSGSYNIYAGSGAGMYETTSADNVAIGYKCFGGERSGGNSNQFNKNTVVGHQALAQQRISNGDGENVCIGYRAMYNVTTGGWRNCIIGFQAGYTQNGASYNTFLGTFAGYNYTSGGNTMCLGYNAGTASSPSGALTTNQDTIVLGNNSISNFYCSDTSISSSDARDKTDITEWTHGLSFINQLKPVTYRWDKRTWYGTDEEPIGTPDGSKKRARLHLGFLAQDALEVEKSFGYASKKDDMLAVNLNEDGSAYGMKYERLVVPLTKAVQELSAEVDKLKAEIAALKS